MRAVVLTASTTIHIPTASSGELAPGCVGGPRLSFLPPSLHYFFPNSIYISLLLTAHQLISTNLGVVEWWLLNDRRPAPVRSKAAHAVSCVPYRGTAQHKHKLCLCSIVSPDCSHLSFLFSIDQTPIMDVRRLLFDVNNLASVRYDTS
jgi:hypothetical protein